ncbi:hypothetical protein [Actinomycetospora soli]|uniref:hypothetical protein n=1 Tax=Actinomycetospora soli TaxID=2893887 RepID=UPI001E3FDFAE|nr:hypothetical protein [Actinomycetospora soli]MCD2185823.1 hypothetical protein [Actinomycetospora soli]
MLLLLGTRGLPPELCTVRVVRPTPVRTIMAVVRDTATHRPPVRAAVESLEGVAAACG